MLDWSMARKCLSLILLCVSVVGCSRESADPTVQIWGRRGSKPGLFSSPRAVAADAECVYAIDRTGRVQALRHDGSFAREWVLEKVDNGTPTALTAVGDGTLWIPDTHNSRILKYDREGNLLRQFGEFGEEPGRFIYPTDIALGDGGELFISEYGKHDRVQVFSPEGRYLRGWGDFGSAEDQFNRPMAVVKGPDGFLYIADSVNHRIKVYSQSGQLQRILGREGNGPGELKFPYDVDVDAEGSLYVCEFGNHRVQQWTLPGAFVREWGGPGPGPGQLSEPWGLAVWKRRMYVADTRNHRIAVFQMEE